MSDLRDPLAIARGLGSAKSGTGHWWAQRLSATALLLLTPWFMVLLYSLAGNEQYLASVTLARPLNAVLMIAWLLAVFWHAQLGLQVVIEDYIHGRAEIALQIGIRLLCAVGAITGVLAVCRIVFAT